MGNGRRLIVVRDADALRADNLEPLKNYLKTPNPRACLAFSDVKFDRRRALYRVLADHAARVDCGPLDEARAAVFVRERLRSRGYGIGADLASAIASGLAGARLGRGQAEPPELINGSRQPRTVA